MFPILVRVKESNKEVGVNKGEEYIVIDSTPYISSAIENRTLEFFLVWDKKQSRFRRINSHFFEFIQFYNV